MELFWQTEIWSWVVLPGLIFLARVCDVSIGTIRLIFVSRGYKFLAPVLSFFEVLIWLVAISQIINNLTNIHYYVAYAGGFAAGTFMGMYLEEKLAMGILLVQIVTNKDSENLTACLIDCNYGVTCLEANGSTGKVDMLMTVIRRNDLRHVLSLIKEYSPKAFYSVTDVKSVNEGIFPVKRTLLAHNAFNGLRFRRKGK